MNPRRTLKLGGLLVLAAVLTACGSSNNAMAPTPPTGGTANVTITITGMNGGNSFSPNPGTVKVGQTVAWRNADVITHTATADNGSFNTGSIAPGSTSNPITMTTTGAFGYHCSIHPTMVGTLNVTP